MAEPVLAASGDIQTVSRELLLSSKKSECLPWKSVQGPGVVTSPQSFPFLFQNSRKANVKKGTYAKTYA